MINKDIVNIKAHDGAKHSYGAWTFTRIIEDATIDNFNELAYLAFNKDVLNDVGFGIYQNGLDHFCKLGHRQNRRMFFNDIEIIKNQKISKLQKYKSIFKKNINFSANNLCYDSIGEKYPLDVPVSCWGYNSDIFKLIEQYHGGVIVDLGAGLRPEYYDDIINIELGNFITTDLRANCEEIPLNDNSVDCLFSIAVLEHVSKPWLVAKEIERIVKPGGHIYIDTAFMAGRHGYPYHYYNMTCEGLANLFTNTDIENVEASTYGNAAYSLFWLARNLYGGLSHDGQRNFGQMTIDQLISFNDPFHLIKQNTYFSEISKSVNNDNAFNITLVGQKK
jgi:SAM-dependent methyltransferase